MFVKAMIPKGTEYVASFNDTPYQTEQVYYTTVEVDESDINDAYWIKHLAKENLIKRIAQREFLNIRYWKSIWLDIVDIQIIRTEN